MTLHAENSHQGLNPSCCAQRFIQQAFGNKDVWTIIQKVGEPGSSMRSVASVFTQGQALLPCLLFSKVPGWLEEQSLVG